MHMAPDEQELLVGLQPRERIARGLDKSTRNRMLGNAFPVSWIKSTIRIWINTVDNDDKQTTACYPLPSPGAQDSPFYQAENTTLQPLQ